MADIPPEIVTECLSRVPAKSLLRFRCVSKSWRATIDSSNFIKMHLNKTLQTNSDRKLILHSSYLYSTDFDELENTNNPVYTELEYPFKMSDIGICILGSCHGLLCLEIGESYSVILWNPTTRKHIKLPFSDFVFSREPTFRTRSVVYGFGYDNLSDDYKVLRIVQSCEGENEVKVFSMKSNSWKKIPCFSYYLKHERAHGVLVAGALHWIVSRKPESDMENLIAAFDIGTEEYRLVPGPNYSKKIVNVIVGVLGESLCVACNYTELCYIDIWVMKKYSVKESWTKLFTVSKWDFRVFSVECGIPVAYSKSGRKVFMVQSVGKPFWYDLEKREIMYSTSCNSNVPFLRQHQMCFGSLVRLDDCIGGSDRKQTIEITSCLRASRWRFH